MTTTPPAPLAKPTHTPAEHYAEAERLMAEALQIMADTRRGRDAAAAFEAVKFTTAMAQVHATLASCQPPDARNQPGHHYYDPTSYDPTTPR